MSTTVKGDRSQRKAEPPRIRTEEEVAAQHHGEWQKWQENLTPDERAQLDKLGLSAPPRPRGRRRVRHAEESDEFPGLGTCDHVASSGLDPAAALMAKEEAQAVHPVVAEYAADNRRELVLLRYALPAIADAEDPRLEVSIIALALGMGAIQGIRLADLVNEHGVEASDIEVRVGRWRLATGVCRADVELLKFFLSPILASRTPALEAEVIAKAARIGHESTAPTMEMLGQKHGVCRQAISRRVRSWCERLGLPLPRECKRNTDAYRLSNVRKQAIDPFEK